MTRAIALLDRPAAASFGMTPIVVVDDERVRVLGLAAASAHRGRGLRCSQVDDLIRSGHALALDAEVPGDLEADTVALWLGNSFTDSAQALGLPPAPLPASPLSAQGGIGAPAGRMA